MQFKNYLCTYVWKMYMLGGNYTKTNIIPEMFAACIIYI